jgi:hypothetical protein
MKTKHLLLGLGLLSSIYANAQLVQESTETGAGIDNGASISTAFTNNAVFFGYRAGYNTNGKIPNGDNNSFIGHQSGYTNSTGASNSYFGAKSGYFSNGSNNVFSGAFAGYRATGNFNTFTGYSSGTNYDPTGVSGTTQNSGANNTFYGYLTGKSNSSGNNNVFVGSSAGFANSTGAYNIFTGTGAGYNHTTGNGNIFLGSFSGSNNVSGEGNTFLGNEAGINNTGSGNVFLGRAAGKNDTGNNKFYIANSDATPLIYGDFTSGKVGIGQVFNYITSDKFPSTSGSVSVSNYKLFVKGGILTEEVRVHLQSGWADYVFADSYRLKPLSEVEQFIAKNGHLPNVPSAKTVAEDGIEVGQMAKIQQEKIEELTLYAIDQNKQLEAQKLQLEQQQKEIDELKAAVNALAANKQ